MKEFVRRYKLGPLIGLIILFIIISILSHQFLTLSNLRNVALQTSVNMLLAVGMTFVILTSGIDLSVGSTLAVSAVVGSLVMTSGINFGLGIVIALIVGILAGLINGLFIAYGRLAPFIVTLGTMTLYRGITEILTHGSPIYNLPKGFSVIGTGSLVGIPIPVILTVIVLIVAWILLNRSVTGRRVYAVGGNEEVAKLAGVPVKKYLLLVYMISGFLAAVAGMILSSRLGSAEPTAGNGYELDAITAVVLGGTSLFGGEGTLVGTIIGAAILGVIDNGLNLLNVNSFWQDAVKGAIILIAIMLDRKKPNQ
ncbi:ABC transporter permease [Pullulanibacillus sp. KACC 23026]|uniref:ABC transporter permease n=1 Tax=Pullulanibacillus sp. KACC 23026 TaxID=3028315 RepID=UPI0023AEFF86|nr:ABC transporter permease [Pullulanibacillus sp. KACC 23026]WEG13325.1 ABC transporter permease [Pullulanibacillus sp. KACC 23026]